MLEELLPGRFPVKEALEDLQATRTASHFLDHAPQGFLTVKIRLLLEQRLSTLIYPLQGAISYYFISIFLLFNQNVEQFVACGFLSQLRLEGLVVLFPVVCQCELLHAIGVHCELLTKHGQFVQGCAQVPTHVLQLFQTADPLSHCVLASEASLLALFGIFHGYHLVTHELQNFIVRAQSDLVGLLPGEECELYVADD